MKDKNQKPASDKKTSFTNDTNEANANSSNKPLQFAQIIIARGEAYKKLLEWPKLYSLRVMRAPIADPNAIAIIGSGEFFDDIITDKLWCNCICEFDIYQEGSCLKELTEYLTEGVQHGSSTSFT